MLFVAVTQLEGLSLEALLTCGKVPTLLSGNTETNESIIETQLIYFLENVIRIASSRCCRLE
jgi:hypothetical protein